MRTGRCQGCRKKGVSLRTKTISEPSEGDRVRMLDLCAACYVRHERGELLFDVKMGRRARSSTSRGYAPSRTEARRRPAPLPPPTRGPRPCRPRQSGGTGRRGGLKIRSPKGDGGSTPPSGTAPE